MALSKIDMLIIRACKSKNPHKRLMSVYRHFWYKGKTQHMHNCFIPKLAKLAGDYSKTSPIAFLDMTRKPSWDNRILSWHEITFENLVSEIQLTRKDYFPEEMVWPVWSRREKENG